MSGERTAQAADPNPAEDAPDSPADLTKRSWRYVLGKTFREFFKDQCTDLAAALTYYAVLSMVPAMIALLSLLSLVGQGQQSVQTLLDILEELGVGPALETIEPILQELSQAPAASFAFFAGLAAALWSASGYIASFGRAMNRVYDIREGRPIWKLRPVLLVLTAVIVVLVALVALALVLTGPLASAIGQTLGIGSAAVTVWNIAKWPVVLIVVVLIVALLYYVTPNVKQPRFRWISVGAVIAIVVWALASAALGFYVSNFGNYDATYGSLAGVVILLLWLWLTNLALLFGAELDAEMERGRELQAGIAAEESIQLPAKDTSASVKVEKKEAEDIRKGRRLRRSRGRDAADATNDEGD